MVILDTQAFRLLGALQFEPGFILLLDLLQSHLDDLTQELSDPRVTSDEALNRLKYWQAFREILTTIRLTPQNYAELLKQEPEAPGQADISNDWLALRRAQQAHYPQGFEGSAG